MHFRTGGGYKMAIGKAGGSRNEEDSQGGQRADHSLGRCDNGRWNVSPVCTLGVGGGGQR